VRLSVLISTYNRCDLLRRSLDALSVQTQPASDFEVVVMVDGSTDGTVDMLRSYEAPYRLISDYQANSGKAVAINRVAEKAVGRYCLLLDDDILPGTDLVAEHVRVHDENDGVIAVGPMALAIDPGADGFTRWFRDVWNEHYERLAGAPEKLSFKACYGGNVSFPLHAFREVGGFATDISRGFDIDLAYRLEQYGLQVAFAPQAVATQHLTKGFREIAWDAERSGVGDVVLYEKHPASLPHLGLERFRVIPAKSFVLRELLLRTHVHPRLLAAMDPLLRRLPASDQIYATIYSYCMWRGVKRALGSAERWRALRRGTFLTEASPGRSAAA
jgi:glycosyltransferase involved in cell wall biosynthesis